MASKESLSSLGRTGGDDAVVIADTTLVMVIIAFHSLVVVVVPVDTMERCTRDVPSSRPVVREKWIATYSYYSSSHL